MALSNDSLSSKAQPLSDISNTAIAAAEDWAPEELTRLKEAVMLIHPSKPRFWQHVAKHVGRRPTECAQKMYSDISRQNLKSLPRTCQALSRRVQMQQQQGVRISSSKRTGPRATEASTRRKMAADSMWQQMQNLHIADAASTSAVEAHGEVAEAVEKLQKQQRAHRYTSSILRRRGGWIKYQRGSKAAAAQVKEEGCTTVEVPLQETAAAAAAGAGAAGAAVIEDEEPHAAESIAAALQQLHARELREELESEEEDDYFSASDVED